MTRIHRHIFLATIAVLLVAAEVRGATIRTVAISGQPLPGAEAEGFQSSLGAPQIDAHGLVSFSAVVGNGGTSLNNNGVWAETAGGLALVVRAPQEAFDLPSGINFGHTSFPVFEPQFNLNGQVAYVGRVNGAGVTSQNESGIWFNDGSSTQLMLREDAAAVGSPSGVRFGGPEIFTFTDLLFNDGGQIVFRSHITGSSDPLLSEGIWTVLNNTVSILGRDGVRAPGTPSGVLFGTNTADRSHVSFPFLSLNSAGQTVFSAALNGNGVTESNNAGIWIADGDTVNLFLRMGMPAPGTAPGTNFDGFPSPAIDPAGHVTFIARLSGGDATSENDSGIWSNRGGTLALVVREGDPAPQVSATARFSSFNVFTLVVNAAGDMAFEGLLTGTGITTGNDDAIWNTSPSGLELVAREGDHAPGTPSGVNFRFNSDIGPVFNATGRSAFISSLTGTGVTSLNDRGIWAEDVSGELRLIVREGDFLEVAPGDLRQISFITFEGQNGNVGGNGSGFNDLGQIAFTASFTDGTKGVFVSNLVAVPEPGVLRLLAIAGFVGMILRPKK
ncbi:MAG: choice-of-anchor tandem repeat NxxGxxAF-containing protein [Pirellulales bacterium]